jgi:hypothetical protein
MNKITIFNNNSSGFIDQITEAAKNLISGKTPVKLIRERQIRGGGNANYINGYDMFRQASLITGFRWSAKCLKEKYIPDEINPVEIGALMEVTLYDNYGNAYSFQSWGSAEVKKYKSDKLKDGKFVYKQGDTICVFDDLKAAYTDGMKKCLSYFGIANDIYAGKEIQYFNDADDQISSNNNDVINKIDQRDAFNKYMRDHNIRYDIILKLLNKNSVSEISDWYEAYKVARQYKENKK